MGVENGKKPRARLLILLVAAAVILAAVVVVLTKAPSRPGSTPGQETTESIFEDSVALPTKYIVLSYPAQIEADVNVSYEETADGQKIEFTTDFTGEELELFSFTISKSENEGYLLGTLEHEQAGSLFVCVNVHEYASGNWDVDVFNKINELQSYVNDIILQFHEDSRFTATPRETP